MCRGWRRSVLALLLSGVLPAGSAQAQESKALEARLREIDHALPALARRAEREREAYDASLRAGLDGPIETRVAGLRIWALPRDVEAATELFRRVWQERFADDLGDDPPPAFSTIRFSYYDHRGGWNPRISEGETTTNFLVQVTNSVDSREEQAERVFGRAFLALSPWFVQLWLDGASGGHFTPTFAGIEALRQLASVDSRSAASCLAGSTRACLITLGLQPDGTSLAQVAREWYSDDQYRALLGKRNQLRAAGTDPALFFVRTRDTELLLPALDPEAPRRVAPEGPFLDYSGAPATGSTRASLLALALERGGPDALARLLALPFETPLRDALEQVSDMPLEQLGDEWRARLDEAGRSNQPAPPTRTTFGWVGLFAALAMTNTRWRLGS